MNLRVTIAFVLLLLGLISPVRGEVTKCDICSLNIKSNYYTFEDKAIGGDKTICPDCRKLETRCFICGLPVVANYTTLKDGRILCERDNREAIHDEIDEKKVCEDVQNELDRKFSRFMTFPSQGLIISFVDRFHLESLFKTTAGFEHCVSIYGAAESHALSEETNFVHSISLLSDLRKPRLMAVCAHEFMHTWITENVKKQRMSTLSQSTIEAFCELIAYKLIEGHDEKFEMQVIRKNDYTKGQINVLLEAEERYGFNTVLDWLKGGEDPMLMSGHLDRIMVMREGDAPTAVAARSPLFVPVAVFKPAPGPDKLTLKGISGTSQRRFAIINDHTFEAMERGKVRLGQASVSIRCLEIRQNSVLIQPDGSKDTQELFLRVN